MNADLNIQKTIAEYAKLHPLKLAIQFADKTITYQELDLKIRGLSKQLQIAGVKKGDIIAVCIPNSIELIISIYAILYMGAVVLPVDLDAPIERVRTIFLDSEPSAALCKKEFQREMVHFNIKSIVVDLKDLDSIADILNSDITGEDDAFCIYTSGSTGTPKGVLLSYKGILNHALAKAELLSVEESSKICLSFNIGFVASIWQILVPILSGAMLIIYDKDLIKKPYQFFKQLEKDQISAISLTPHTLSAFMEYFKIGKQRLPLPNMRYIILTGEKVDGNLVKEFYKHYNHIDLVNAYGQTECSDDTYHYIIPHSFDSGNVPIGTPITNINGLILNENLEEVEFGELFISGTGVSRGYLHNQKLTEAKFLNLPLCKLPLYKTGDLVRKDDNGILVYHGRMDNQVKIRGHLIELEEIEIHINQFKGVSKSIVRTVDVNENDKTLEAIYTGMQMIDKGALMDYLSKKLPAYMIPAKFTQIDTFSYTSNGKIDRKNINILIESNDGVQSSNIADNMSKLQRKAFATIKSNIDESVFPNISVDTNLLGIGVDSITYIRIVVSLEEAFNIEFDDEMLLFTAFPTLRSLIEYVETKILASSSGEDDDS